MGKGAFNKLGLSRKAHAGGTRLEDPGVEPQVCLARV